MQAALQLAKLPKVIECFDISMLGGEYTVASMVVFRDGAPDKSGYQRFRIKDVEGVDDFSCMKEVIRRRYARVLREGGQMPDLIVVDGGAGQLSAAREVLDELEINVLSIGLAKQNEEIYTGTGMSTPTIVLDRKSDALHLIQQIRDEAHRFAVSYNRVLMGRGIWGVS